MLTKNKLFKRNAEQKDKKSKQIISPGLVETEEDKSEATSYITPGHLAAIKSAAIANTTKLEARIKRKLGEEPTTHQRSPEKVLMIGSDVEIYCAEIAGCQSLMVEGSIETSLVCKTVLITDKGYFSGRAEVDNAEIYGNFNGELYVKNLLYIHPDAIVIGKIRYGQLSIEEGGKLSGDVAMHKDEQPEPMNVAHIRPDIEKPSSVSALSS